MSVIAAAKPQVFGPQKGGKDAVFGGRLEALDTLGGKAYGHAEDDELYLLVQNPKVPYRQNVIDGYNRFKASCLSDLRASSVRMTPDGNAAVHLLQRPTGGPVFTGKPTSDRILRQVVLPSILPALKSMHDEGVTYRNFAAERLFFKSSENDEAVLLESFSMPAGLGHSSSYETVNRAMVPPVSRGEGEASDDYYALGALIAQLMLGRDPKGQRTDQHYLQARLVQGSFAAATSGSNVTGAVATLLRGLLHDNPLERWGARHIVEWLGGELRRVSPNQGQWMMAQPISFGGRTYSDKRALAAAFQASPDAAHSTIRRQTTGQWVAQVAPGSDAHQALVNYIDHGNAKKRVESGSKSPDWLLARFCSLLDPYGPIRYRDMSLMPDGLGPTIASAFIQENAAAEGTLKSLLTGTQWHGIMEMRQIMTSEGAQTEQMQSRVSWLREAGQARDSFIKAYYALNEGLPCASPEIGEAWVDTPLQLLAALDARCQGGGEGLNLMEENLLAFLAARAPAVRRHTQSLRNMKPELRDVSFLRMFGELQSQYGAPPMKNLAKVLFLRIKGQVQQLKSRTRREMVISKLEELSSVGNMSMMAKLLNLDRLKSADARGYSQARNRIAKIDRRIKFLSRKINPSDQTAIAQASRYGSYAGMAALAGSVLLRLF